MVDPVLTIAAALSVQSPFHRLLKGGESAVQVECLQSITLAQIFSSHNFKSIHG